MQSTETLSGWISSWVTILPVPILSLFIGIVLVGAALQWRDRWLTFWSGAGLVAAFISLFFLPVGRFENSLFVMDSLGDSFLALIFAAAWSVVALLQDSRAPESCLLLLTATLGSSLLVISHHFAPFFLGFEILSVSLYGLIAFQPEAPNRIEAGTKYLILAGMSSAFLLLGIALLYACSGSLGFSSTDLLRTSSQSDLRLLGSVGMMLILVGIGFKLALAPFHMWSPDIYEGAPPLTVAFLSTVSKGAAFIAFYRIFWRSTTLLSTGGRFSALGIAMLILAVTSMLVGSLLALRQNNIKRLLAYSSVAHLGYFLFALLTGVRIGLPAAVFYWMSYFLALLSAFGVVTLLSQGGRHTGNIREYEGLFWTHPLSASVLSLSLFSLAGIPLTGGFIAKFYIISVGINASLWGLVSVVILTSVLSLYYYLRVIGVIFKVPSRKEDIPKYSLSMAPLGATVLGTLSLFSVWLGIYPAPILTWITDRVVR